MLNISKIESDINFKNLTKIDVSEVMGIPYTTTINRLKNGNWTPDEVEKLADYFGRTIAYYFDRDEKQAQTYKNDEKLQVVEDNYGKLELMRELIDSLKESNASYKQMLAGKERHIVQLTNDLEEKETTIEEMKRQISELIENNPPLKQRAG